MGFFNKEVELIVPPKNQNKTIKIKSLNGYDAIRGKIDEGNTLSVKSPAEPPTKPKTKVSIGLQLNYLFLFYLFIYLYIFLFELWLSLTQVISLGIVIVTLLLRDLMVLYLQEV